MCDLFRRFNDFNKRSFKSVSMWKYKKTLLFMLLLLMFRSQRESVAEKGKSRGKKRLFIYSCHRRRCCRLVPLRCECFYCCCCINPLPATFADHTHSSISIINSFLRLNTHTHTVLPIAIHLLSVAHTLQLSLPLFTHTHTRKGCLRRLINQSKRAFSRAINGAL